MAADYQQKTSFFSFCVTMAALLLSVSPGKAQTWVQWRSADGGNNHYYALTPTATNWTAAQDLAVSWGGTLATITSSNEQNFINTAVLTGNFEHLPLWIGLHKSSSKGGFSGKLGSLHVKIGFQPNTDFHWVTHESLSYTNWKSGEPSDTPPGEDYVAMNWAYSDVPSRGAKGDWNDTPANGTTGYGGKTDGPYFGLVERETDPSRPASTGFKKYVIPVALITALTAVLLFYFARGRKYASSAT